jgi:hypothetical protein
MHCLVVRASRAPLALAHRHLVRVSARSGRPKRHHTSGVYIGDGWIDRVQ